MLMFYTYICSVTLSNGDSFFFLSFLLFFFYWTWDLSQDASLSVVFIKDLELTKVPKSSSKGAMLNDDEDAKVEGTGSGFIWDKFGHIVRKVKWLNQNVDFVRPT